MSKIPVILDTDIGGDIDDTWAVIMLLRSMELETKLITTCTGDPVYRTKIIAKMFERAGCTDIPLGIGVRGEPDCRERQKDWVADYNLSNYPGTVHDDGIQSMIDEIDKAEDGITIIAIGPLTNIAELIRLRPDVTEKVTLIAMAGSIRKNHCNQDGAIPEFNVEQDFMAAKSVFAAPWKKMVITPLDSCGNVILRDDDYQQVFKSKDPMICDLMDNYKIWLKDVNNEKEFPAKSSILYDTVAIHLAYSTEFLEMQEMTLVVDDKGFTKEDPKGMPVHVASDMLDQAGFNRFLVDRLLGNG